MLNRGKQKNGVLETISPKTPFFFQILKSSNPQILKELERIFFLLRFASVVIF